MKTLVAIACLGSFATLVACGQSVPPPNDQYAAAQNEVGRVQASRADAVPAAKLHLRLAQEDLAQAKAVMSHDNLRARTLIDRANAEAALAMSLARHAQTDADARAATEQLNKAKGH